MEAMRHTCALCGEENEVLVPKGYTLLKKPATLAESDSRRIDREWEPALSFQEAYQRRLRKPSYCAHVVKRRKNPTDVSVLP